MFQGRIAGCHITVEAAVCSLQAFCPQVAIGQNKLDFIGSEGQTGKQVFTIFIGNPFSHQLSIQSIKAHSHIGHAWFASVLQAISILIEPHQIADLGVGGDNIHIGCEEQGIAAIGALDVPLVNSGR